MASDGLLAQRANPKAKLMDAELGLSDGSLPCREVRRDEAYQRESAKKIFDEIRIVPFDLTEAPLEESWVSAAGAGSVENLADVEWSRCQPGSGLLTKLSGLGQEGLKGSVPSPHDSGGAQACHAGSCGPQWSWGGGTGGDAVKLSASLTKVLEVRCCDVFARRQRDWD